MARLGLSGGLDPIEAKAREGQLVAAFVKAENRAVGQDGEVGVRRLPWLKQLAHRPGVAVVVAQLDREILPLPLPRGNLRACFIAGHHIGVAKEQGAGLGRMGNNAGHADGLEKIRMKHRLGPISCAVGTEGEELSIGLRFTAHHEHDTTIGQFSERCLVRVNRGLRIVHCDLAGLPRPARVIAVDRPGHGRPMLALLAVG